MRRRAHRSSAPSRSSTSTSPSSTVISTVRPSTMLTRSWATSASSARRMTRSRLDGEHARRRAVEPESSLAIRPGEDALATLEIGALGELEELHRLALAAEVTGVEDAGDDRPDHRQGEREVDPTALASAAAQAAEVPEVPVILGRVGEQLVLAEAVITLAHARQCSTTLAA